MTKLSPSEMPTSTESPDPDRPADADRLDQFVQLLTRHQSRLYAFIYTLTANPERAGDVFQETNMALWRMAGEFDHSRPFLPWAFAIARNQVRAWRLRNVRDRHRFDDDTLALVADRAEQRISYEADPQSALAHCLEELPDRQRSLIEQRYRGGISVQELAASNAQTAGALAVMLHRIRQSLARCIQGRLAREEFA